jgi:hypothetical protein
MVAKTRIHGKLMKIANHQSVLRKHSKTCVHGRPTGYVVAPLMLCSWKIQPVSFSVLYSLIRN